MKYKIKAKLNRDGEIIYYLYEKRFLFWIQVYYSQSEGEARRMLEKRIARREAKKQRIRDNRVKIKEIKERLKNG